MASYIGSVFNRAYNYLYPQESDPGRRNEPQQQQQPRPEPTPRGPKDNYPKSPKDTHQTMSLLNHVLTAPLPAEILKIILYHASYDSITCTASSNKQVNVIARSAAGPPARACVESPHLTYLGPSSTLSHSSPPGRIRNLQLKFTGRDQGWTSEPGTASWSWFEIVKKSPESGDVIQRGPVLAHNAVAGQDWEEFQIMYDVGEERCRGIDEELRTWIEGLKGGEKVCIIPMAKYGGWQCRVLKATVDVDVEVWY